jgi:hypothetical protein
MMRVPTRLAAWRDLDGAALAAIGAATKAVATVAATERCKKVLMRILLLPSEGNNICHLLSDRNLDHRTAPGDADDGTCVRRRIANDGRCVRR